MLSHSPRRLLLLGVILGTVALSACATGGGAGTTQQAADSTVAPATAATPATAAEPAIASQRATPTPSATRTRSAAGTRTSAASTSAASHAPAAAAVVPAAAISGATVYGFSAPELLSQSATVQLQELKAMKAMGVTSVRLDADWYYGQPTGAGSYDWTALDQVIASIQQAGLSADFIIDGCPPWAAVAGAQGQEFAQPASPAAFGKWAGAVAARYGPKGVRYFEIWNEPNLPNFWEPKPDPAAYTADLIAAYAAIKAVDPSAIVISGGLAPAADTSTSYDPRTFLTDMYADGAKGSFDGVGDHPYSYPASPDNGLSAWSQMSGTSPSLRGIMSENGDSAKKIWITEYGAPTIGPSAVSEADQSTELVQAISQVKQLSWIGSFYIYTWSDLSSSPAVDNGFGLLSENDTQKSAYPAVASALP